MKLWQKNKFIKDGKTIKKYKFCGFTVLRKEKSKFKKKWNFLGIKITKNSDIFHLFEKQKIKINKPINILLPVYNGFEYLQNLFDCIKNNTDLPYKLYVINDCSTDKRVLPFLEKQKESFSDLMVLINNDKNLGFVKSVNKLFDRCRNRNHLVIINTDIILPEKWASRLMAPIFKDKKVATVTPFSNAATIFSLPKIFENNIFYEDLKKIDNAISKLNGKNKLLKFATGVGFCMAINRKALKKVGNFDDIFEQGYGEENDWCQRAIKKGFYNTLATNLFVWHKHGGSFDSKKKKAFCQQHLSILQKRYSSYISDINKNTNNYYYKIVHFIAEILYFNASSKSTQVWFDHSWGGGANIYTQKNFEELKKDTFCIRIISDQSDHYQIDYTYKDNKNAFYFSMEEIKFIFKHINISEIVVNNLASYKDVLKTLQDIEELKKLTNANVSFRAHDLQCICPTITMLNGDDKYCNCKNFSNCTSCIARNKNVLLNCLSIEEWHQKWQYFLQNVADEIIVFSQSTFDIYIKLYRISLDKIKIIPHTIKPLRKVKINPHKTVNIGILGVIGKHKGAEKVCQFDKLLPQYENVKISIIGFIPQVKLQNIKETGSYNVDDLPDIIEKNKIDIIFIPSIWPETFSYTTAEAMSMGMLLACYNIGAPAERIRCYKKGLIINSMENSKQTLDLLINFVQEQKKSNVSK